MFYVSNKKHTCPSRIDCMQGYNTTIYIQRITRSCRTPFVLRGLTALSQHHQWKAKEALWKESCSTAPCRCKVGVWWCFGLAVPKKGFTSCNRGAPSPLCGICNVGCLCCGTGKEEVLRVQGSAARLVINLKVDCFLLKLTDLPSNCFLFQWRKCNFSCSPVCFA